MAFIPRLLAGLTLAAALLPLAQAQPQTFPQRPLQVVVPVAAGGGTDVLARAVGQKVSEILGQPLVVENKLGAGGNIGVEMVVKAKPDGYTLLFSPSTIATNVAVYRKLPYDLQTITLIGQTDVVLVVHPSVKATNLKEFVELARSRPGKMNFGSAGLGSSQHLTAEYFNQLAGTSSNHIPYKGQSQAMNDLVGGQLDYMFSPLQNALPFIRQGQIRAIALAAKRVAPPASGLGRAARTKGLLLIVVVVVVVVVVVSAVVGSANSCETVVLSDAPAPPPAAASAAPILCMRALPVVPPATAKSNDPSPPAPPAEANPRPQVSVGGASSAARAVPSRSDHTRTVLSRALAAAYSPEGSTATDTTPRVWPAYVCARETLVVDDVVPATSPPSPPAPSGTSHARTVSSTLPVRTRWVVVEDDDPGTHARDHTPSSCAATL